MLFNYLGLGEDDTKLVLKPDCADMPYFLRAYFAFKMGLPFGYSKCTRGDGGQAPRCHAWWNIQNLEPPPALPEPVEQAAPAEPPRTVSGGPFDLFRQPARGSLATVQIHVTSKGLSRRRFHPGQEAVRHSFKSILDSLPPQLDSTQPIPPREAVIRAQ